MGFVSYREVDGIVVSRYPRSIRMLDRLDCTYWGGT